MVQISQAELDARINELPPLSPVVTTLLELLNQPSVDYAALERAAVREPTLVARVLRLANSPFFGVSGQIATFREACLVLGSRSLRQVIMAISVMDTLAVDTQLLELRQVWSHALAVAAIARHLAPLKRIDPDYAFTAGLLHDIGRLALAVFFAGPYAQAMAHKRENGCSLVDAERQCFGFDHGTAGEKLARKWHLPEELALAIGRHHRPDEAEQLLVDLIHFADVLAHALEYGLDEGEGEAVPRLHARVWNRLGWDWSYIGGLLPHLDREARDAGAIELQWR